MSVFLWEFALFFALLVCVVGAVRELLQMWDERKEQEKDRALVQRLKREEIRKC